MRVDGFVGELFDKIAFPVPLKACGQQRIEHALQSRERHWPHPVKDCRRKFLADWFDCFLRLVEWAAIARDQGADLSAPEVVGKGGRRGYCLHPKKRAKLERRL